MISQKHGFKTTLALAAACSAIAPAGALARVPSPDFPQPTSPSVQVLRVSTDSGFDWGDAGIGAAGALGLSMLAAGGILVVTRRRTHGPSGATS